MSVVFFANFWNLWCYVISNENFLGNEFFLGNIYSNIFDLSKSSLKKGDKHVYLLDTAT